MVDVTAAVAGGALGVTAALLGASYWALVVQIVTTDVVMLLMSCLAGAGIRPNRQLGRLREIMAFSWRAFTAGPGQLGLPEHRQPPRRQVPGSRGARFLRPRVSAVAPARSTPERDRRRCALPGVLAAGGGSLRIRSELTRATRTLAALVLPAMALVAAAAPQLVAILFGDAWEPAVPIVQVLAMVGAVQAIYRRRRRRWSWGSGTQSSIFGMRCFTTTVAIIGIVAGIPFSPLAVALGYAAATVALVPVEWIIRRRLLEMTCPARPALSCPASTLRCGWRRHTRPSRRACERHDLVALALGVPVSVAVGIGRAGGVAHPTPARRARSHRETRAGSNPPAETLVLRSRRLETLGQRLRRPQARMRFGAMQPHR